MQFSGKWMALSKVWLGLSATSMGICHKAEVEGLVHAMKVTEDYSDLYTNHQAPLAMLLGAKSFSKL
eukprot:12910296-Prorocentrum_lima.AAC.1